MDTQQDTQKEARDDEAIDGQESPEGTGSDETPATAEATEAPATQANLKNTERKKKNLKDLLLLSSGLSRRFSSA